MRQLIFLILLICFLPVTAQDTLYVVDEFGESLPFASIRLSPDSTYAGIADEAGRFVLPPGLAATTQIEVTYLGYRRQQFSLGQLRRQDYTCRMEARNDTTLSMPTIIGRRDEDAQNLPYQLESIHRNGIAHVQSLTTADALADLSGVYVQKSQFGGGSPVIRGFEANRILLVVDGVRMNNAIFRNGHLQNAITVDPLALERLELIYGAGALAYGSDAIGGVVHFRTREPGFLAVEKANMEQSIPEAPVWKSNGALSFSSAARHFGQSLSLEYQSVNFASLTLLSANFTSHLRSGAHRDPLYPDFGSRPNYIERLDGTDQVVDNPAPNRQIGTAYDQYNLLQKFRFRLGDQLELSANFQYSTTSAIPRYDALTETRNGQLRWARWDYGPQTRALGSLRLNDRRPTSLYDVATYQLSHQFVEEDRLQRRFNDPFEENSLVDVNATNLQIDYVKDFTFLQLRYGLDLRYDQVSSTAFFRNLTTGQVATLSLATRYPSQGSSLSGGGLYAEATHAFSRWWQLRGGVRYSKQQLSARFGATDPVEWPARYLEGIDNTQGALTAALGLLHTQGPHRWRTLLAQGFRAPNVDDFAKFRESNGFIQVPNPALQPERSLTLETGYRYQSRAGGFDGSLTAYHTWLDQAIIRSSGWLPDGSSSFVSRGDTLFAQTNSNAESARVFGIDLEATVAISEYWKVGADAHWLRGIREQGAPDGTTLTLPQDHIPPPYGKASLSWARKAWTLSAVLRYQLAKAPADYAVGSIEPGPDGYVFDRLGTADNLELTPLNPDGSFAGSQAWWTLNGYASWSISSRWDLRLKAENLLDRHYRTFASGVSAPGLNLGLSISGQLL